MNNWKYRIKASNNIQKALNFTVDGVYLDTSNLLFNYPLSEILSYNYAYRDKIFYLTMHNKILTKYSSISIKSIAYQRGETLQLRQLTYNFHC